MHHFILQLDKGVTPDECFELLDDFISSIIDFFIHSDDPPLEYLILPKSSLLGFLYESMQTTQTNNYIFLIISEKMIDFSKL